ncbi:hypothetical protein, partial [Streptosporangium saharense]|uniref:hypothetical protein n=1 Tax=Streptosporangium saharense TaxID=1706840 RepID=UPI003316CE5B
QKQDHAEINSYTTPLDVTGDPDGVDGEEDLPVPGGAVRLDRVRQVHQPEGLAVVAQVPDRDAAGGRKIAEKLHKTRGGVDEVRITGPGLLRAHAALFSF